MWHMEGLDCFVLNFLHKQCSLQSNNVMPLQHTHLAGGKSQKKFYFFRTIFFLINAFKRNLLLVVEENRYLFNLIRSSVLLWCTSWLCSPFIMENSRGVSTQLLNAMTSEMLFFYMFFLRVKDSLTNTKTIKLQNKKPELVCGVSSTHLQLSLCNSCLQVKCYLALWVLERCKTPFPDENGNAQLSPCEIIRMRIMNRTLTTVQV